MRPFYIIFVHPDVQNRLQRIKRMIQLTPERNLIKFLQDGLVEAFADAICLVMTRLAFGMFNAVDRRILLVIMRFQLAAVFLYPCLAVCG